MTGAEQPLAHPNLVCDVAIGQSTGPTQRVLGNLFYRGLILLTPVLIGDTLRTRTEVVALKQNSRRREAPPRASSRCGSAPATSATSPCSTSGAAR